MNALEAVEAVVAASPQAAFISALGTATSALRAATDDGPHFYMGGAMGSALAVALGVAEAAPRVPVVAIVGDGELLMGASSLWSVAGLAPANLTVVVLVDGLYGITGGQQLVTDPRFGAVAQALGLSSARAASTDELGRLLSTAAGPVLVEAVISPPNTWERPSPFVDPAATRHRFAARLLELGRGG